MSKTFAAFIMTYERPTILQKTIEKIMCQTLVPEKILVVDNSESDTTKQVVEGLADPRVVYHRTGFNAGPAGAARIGLTQLAGEGYRWIYWGDDDNPPVIENTFERLLTMGDELIGRGIKVGALGVTGSYFSRFRCTLSRIEQGRVQPTNEVDVIPANKLIIHSSVVQAGIIPNSDLFFGFEEMDFSLKMRSQGFHLICHGELLKQHRELFGREKSKEVRFETDNEYQRLRRYYGYRNMLFILFHTNHYYWASMILIVRILMRSLLNIRFGLAYFRRNGRVYWLAITDGLSGRLGRRQNLKKE